MRVSLARSLAWGLSLLGADVHLLGPPGLVPERWPGIIGFAVHRALAAVDTRFDIVIAIPIAASAARSEFLPSSEELRRIFALKNHTSARDTLFVGCPVDANEIYFDPIDNEPKTTLSSNFVTASVMAAVTFASQKL
jgi:hypothetical protein